MNTEKPQDNRYISVEPGDERLPGPVFSAELDAIEARRRTYGLDAPAEGAETAPDRPDVGCGLVGLALSGGGIRSATFSLGVVQALGRAGLLPHVDYLSTVSGGGFLGGCLSSVFATAPDDVTAADETDDIIITGVPAGARIDGATMDADGNWRASGTTTLALVLSSAPVPRTLGLRAVRAGNGDRPPRPFVIRPRGPLPRGLVCMAGTRAGSGTFRVAVDGTDAEITLPLAFTMDAFAFRHRVGEVEGPVFRHLRDNADYLKPRQFLAGLRMPAFFLRGLVINFLILLPLLLTAALVTLGVVGGPLHTALHDMTGGAAADLRNSVLTALRGTVVAGLVVLAAYPMVQWWVERGLGAGWRGRDWLGRHVAGGAVMAVGVAVFVLLQPLAVLWLHDLGSARIHGIGDGAEAMTMAVALALGLGILFSGPLAGRASGLMGRIGLATLGLAGPVIVWLFYLNLCRWALVPEAVPLWLALKAELLGDIRTWLVPGMADNTVALVYVVVAVAVYGVTRIGYDVNATSFHSFYRDRLSRTFLVNPWRAAADGSLWHNDGQKLSTLDVRRAPYHLINATLNVQMSKRANLRGRGGAFFTFARNYVGGPLTGYRATREMEHLNPGLDLGTAVAVSGAAAAPNMGSETQRRLTFVLSLLNIRLGYWLHHPASFNAAAYRGGWSGWLARTLVRPFSRVTPAYLLREMLGRLDETGPHVNLTDGGHLENLGLYELLRRRCRIIIACDGEADPRMTFKGLSNAIRMARIDLGVNVDIDVEPLRIDPATGWSRAHSVVGRIHYGGGDYGYILYIKSSMTGDEPVTIRKYRDDDLTFPHQTTADQFFDEAQFEAYRALGHHVGDQVLGDLFPGRPLFAGIDPIVDRFATRFGERAGHTDQPPTIRPPSMNRERRKAHSPTLPE